MRMSVRRFSVPVSRCHPHECPLHRIGVRDAPTCVGMAPPKDIVELRGAERPKWCPLLAGPIVVGLKT